MTAQKKTTSRMAARWPRFREERPFERDTPRKGGDAKRIDSEVGAARSEFKAARFWRPQPAGRRRISTIEVKLRTGTPSWFVTVVADRNEPISGLEREGRTSTMVEFTWSVSPG